MEKEIMARLHQKNVLYISYTGLLEPLGQSQVYRYLDHLSEEHEITLITFEKASQIEDKERFESMKDRVADSGIKWHPLRYHQAPSVPATIYDLAKGFIACTRAIRQDEIDIVHSRSYVASILGLMCKQFFDTAFVFDMRGFWADERVEGGIWEEDSRLYQIAKWFEAKFIQHADMVVSLTEAGIDVMRDFDHIDTTDTRFTMIPTCVDLDLFTPDSDERSEEFVLGYVGSVGTWYLFDDVLDCFELLQELRPGAELSILNQGDHDVIREKLRQHDIDESDVSLKSVRHEEVSGEIDRMDAGVFLIKPTFSKNGSSPTKMGEFLACGVPCLSNAGYGDVKQILEENDVGVAMESFDTNTKRNAIRDLIQLASDPDTSTRCRETAESYYSLEEGVAKYNQVYRTVASDE